MSAANCGCRCFADGATKYGIYLVPRWMRVMQSSESPSSAVAPSVATSPRTLQVGLGFSSRWGQLSLQSLGSENWCETCPGKAEWWFSHWLVATIHSIGQVFVQIANDILLLTVRDLVEVECHKQLERVFGLRMLGEFLNEWINYHLYPALLLRFR